jgi:hypothetical protein
MSPAVRNKNKRFILFSDRKLESDLRDGFVSGEAAFAANNGNIFAKRATKHGANPAAKNLRFLLEDRIIKNTSLCVQYTQGEV